MSKKRQRSIRTPPRRDHITPSKRETTVESGPTREAIIQRCKQIGVAFETMANGRVVPEANIQRSTDALSLLAGRDEITGVQLQSGFVYGYLHMMLFGQSWPSAADYSGIVHEVLDVDSHVVRDAGRLTEEDREAYRRGAHYRFGKADQALQRRVISNRVRPITRIVCLQGLMPRTANEMTFLHSGLNAIAFEFGFGGMVRTGKRRKLAGKQFYSPNPNMISN
ncbi:MAG: hypothetical protein GY952_14000 [Rhodobacteraceae bacterium]|nr:hypothetical protein [Paracoccaceae bacterium]